MEKDSGGVEKIVLAYSGGPPEAGNGRRKN